MKFPIVNRVNPDLWFGGNTFTNEIFRTLTNDLIRVLKTRFPKIRPGKKSDIRPGKNRILARDTVLTPATATYTSHSHPENLGYSDLEDTE